MFFTKVNQMENETKTEAAPSAKVSKRTRKPVVKPVEVVTAPVAEETAAKKVKKEVKVKVVRDSFTMPQSEYQKISEIKEICLKSGRHVKKSEVLRAGLQALVNMSETQLQAALAGLETIRTGRPKKR
jgi:hypothetical protein